MPDIKLPSLIQKRPLYVLLQDESFLAAVEVPPPFLQDNLYLLKG